MCFRKRVCLAIGCLFFIIKSARCDLVLAHGEGAKLAKQQLQQENGFEYTPEEMKKFKIWPRGIIPYFIDDFSFDKVLRDRIRLYLEEASAQTGLQFVELPRPPDDNSERWVLFVNRIGMLECDDYSATKFTTEGVQKVVLGYDCLAGSGSGLAGAVLTIAGVPPQHNSPDRDNYLQVLTDNIIPEKRHLFQAVSNDNWLFHDLDYDFASAGHYDFYKYTINGHLTLQPKMRAKFQRSDEAGLSSTDIVKIRMLYNYISQNKQSKMKSASDCSRLFRPGPKFDKVEALKKSETVLKARPKPEKYGLKTNATDPKDSKDSTPVLADKKKGKDKLSFHKREKKKSKMELSLKSDFNTSE